jgi:hypothetical protein
MECSCISTYLAACITAAAVSVAFGDIKSDFLTRLRDHIPKTGAVHVVFQSNQGVGEVACGYSAESGAWYRIDEYAVRGQDCSMLGFAGPPSFPLVKAFDFNYSGANACLDSLLPVAMLSDIVARPELVRDVSRLDSGFLVEVEFTSGSREADNPPATGQHPAGKPSHAWLRTNEECIFQYMSYESSDAARRGPACVLSSAVPAMMAPVSEFDLNPWKVVSCSYEPVVDCDKFERSHVVATAVEMKVRLAKKLAAFSNATAPSEVKSDESASRTYDSTSDPSSRSISIAVGVVGLVLLSLGVSAWVRSRKSTFAGE